MIPSGYVQTIFLHMQAGQRAEGTLTILSRYSLDAPDVSVRFLAEDPSGRVAVNASPIDGVQVFSLIAGTTGRYNLVLYNSNSLLTPAEVDVIAQVWSR